MAKISSFIYCEQADLSMGEKPQIGEFFEVLRPDHIPGNYSFSIVFSLMDVNEPQLLKVQFVDPDKSVILETEEFTINGNAGDGQHPDFNGVFVAFDFRNMSFKVEGVYETLIYINNDIIGSFPIPVIQKEGE